jgi:hypothetical protein
VRNGYPTKRILSSLDFKLGYWLARSGPNTAKSFYFPARPAFDELKRRVDDDDDDE